MFFIDVSTTDLSAASPIDYAEIVATTVDFAANIASETVSITIESDTYHEDDEHFLITLHDPLVGELGDLYKSLVIIKDTNSPGKIVMLHHLYDSVTKIKTLM